MYRVDYTENDRLEALEILNSGAIAVFIYTSNLIVNGERKRYAEDKSVRAIAQKGITYVPISFFTDFIGADVKKTDSGYIIAKSGYKAETKAEEKNGIVYVPLSEISKAIGYCTGSFYENRLTVIGSDEQIEKFKSNPLLAEAASYEIFGEFEADSFTSADYKDAKDRWRLRIVGSPEVNDMSDPFVRAKIEDIDKRCQKKWETINKPSADGSDPIILWGDHAPTESGELSTQYGGIYDMAKAYGSFGSAYYKNQELLKDIIYALDWMYAHMYGEAEIEERGWRSARIFNWWFWHVGGPDYLTDVLLIIEDSLTMADKKKYLKCYEWVTTIMRTGPNRACSSSRLKCGTKTALLLEDPVRLASAQWDCDSLFGIEEDGEGPHKDYVQWTHNFPHNISYALGNLQRTLFTSSILAPTAMDFSGPKKYNQFMLLKYTFEPAMYTGQGFVMFSGRSTAGSELGAGSAVLAGLLPMIGVYGEDEDAYIKAMIKRHSSLEKTRDLVRSQCSIFDLATYNKIIEDDSISYDNSNYEYAHAWFTGDRAAQHRNNYAVGIALSSEREVSYESINSANQRGWYTGDGALYLYTDYDSAQYDGANFLTRNLKVAYNFPGTTEDSQTRVERSILNGEAWKNPTAFSGSMQIHDKYLTCGMDFISMRFEGPDKNIVDTGYGSGLAVHNNDLSSKKAWFCFDNEIVVLEAGITSTMNSDVHTTVEHRRILKDKALNQIVRAKDGAERILEGESKVSLDNADWALMQGHAGYVFFGESSVTAEKYVSDECYGQEFFLLNIDHGKNPNNASHAYAILPYADEAILRNYSKNPDVEILSNTASLQAVYEKNIGMTGYVFHEAGKLNDRVSASVPSLVTTVEVSGVYEIYVCDPTHKLTEGEFVINRKLALDECDNNISVSYDGATTVIKADFNGAHGRTYKAIFKI